MKLSNQVCIYALALTILTQFTDRADADNIYPSRSDECNRLIMVLNQTVAETNAVSNNGRNGDVQTINKLVNIFDNASRDISALDISDEQLIAYRNQFLAMYQGGSEIAKKLVSNIKKQNLVKVHENLRRYASIVSPERDLINRLNKYCQTPNPLL